MGCGCGGTRKNNYNNIRNISSKNQLTPTQRRKIETNKARQMALQPTGINTKRAELERKRRLATLRNLGHI